MKAIIYTTDAINVALLVLESRRVVPGFLIKSLSDHNNSPGRLAEYKRQIQRVVRRPRDDPLIFAIFELETLAQRAFIDIDISIQLQMVRDRFIDGQGECALRRHLDSLGPDTPMADIVDCCRVWESHSDVEMEPRISADRRPARAVCQVTVDKQIPTASPETETLGGHHSEVTADAGATASSGEPNTGRPGSPHPAIDGNDMPTEAGGTGAIGGDGIGNHVTELAPGRNSHGGEPASPNPSADSAEGCFSCGGLTHTTDQCRTLDELFPFLPTGWQAEHIGDQFILGPGPPARPQGQQMGNAD